MTVMRGYKVVRCYTFRLDTPQVYEPAVLQPIAHPIFYQIMEVTKRDPKVQGPLAVFRDEESARQFMNSVTYLKQRGVLLQVEYRPSTETDLWELIDGVVHAFANRYLPDGTALAEWVKPLGVVEVRGEPSFVLLDPCT